MRRVAEGFDAAGRTELAAWCRHVVEEESGHDELALRDLAALGLRAEAFVAEVRPSNALRLVELFQNLAEGPEPVAVLGYAYVLERMALFTTAERVAAVEAALPPGVKATRCLRVHSGAGADVRHVRESIDFIATLPAADRRHICNGAFAAASLMAVEPDYPGDEIIDEWVARFGMDTSSLGA
jgi:pyrroloquinoline quinone (PQQ) biosynthesis protein C